MKTTKNRIEDLDFGLLGVICAWSLILVLVLTGAIHIGSHSISPKKVPDSIRAATDFDTVATFVQSWETEDPVQFFVFVGVLLVPVAWLVRRSPWLVGIVLVAVWFTLWLKLKVEAAGN